MMPKKRSDKRSRTEPKVEVLPATRPNLGIEKALSEEFDFKNCPEGYEEIKAQAIRLGRLSGYAFILMAHRLVQIRDRKLYKQDGYTGFGEFLTEELGIARATGYRYMSILDAFGEILGLLDAGYPFARLREAVPLLNAEPIVERPRVRKQLRHKLVHHVRHEEFDAFYETIEAYSEKYDVFPETAEPTPHQSAAKAAETLIGKLPPKPNKELRVVLSALRDRLNEIL